jgi:hypothetical protein
LLLSFTVAVKFAVPAVVGVPLMVPFALGLKPAGSAPAEMLQVYPPVPPLAPSVCEYAVLAVAPGNDVVVIVSGAMVTVMLSCFDAVSPFASVTVIAGFEVAAAVGVPAIVPDELRLRPAGNAPAVTLQL